MIATPTTPKFASYQLRPVPLNAYGDSGQERCEGVIDASPASSPALIRRLASMTIVHISDENYSLDSMPDAAYITKQTVDINTTEVLNRGVISDEVGTSGCEQYRSGPWASVERRLGFGNGARHESSRRPLDLWFSPGSELSHHLCGVLQSWHYVDDGGPARVAGGIGVRLVYDPEFVAGSEPRGIVAGTLVLSAKHGRRPRACALIRRPCDFG
jgi:hypothetical protein